jgi:uncharacterized LabA/DUF88 family protein
MPNYEPVALARAVCSGPRWTLERVRFYTGLRDPRDDPFWYSFWSANLAAMKSDGIEVITRPLRYRRVTVRLPDGGTHSFVSREEKGIDVRIALDVMRLAHRREYEVALLFSQDQDFAEVAREICVVAADQRRWIKIASAFPEGAGARKGRGIDLTDWIPIARTTYDACLDPRDFRPRGRSGPGAAG